jgi:hypothetical protein
MMVRGGFEFQGQKCSAASRVYVPKSIWNAVRDRAVAMINDIKMGDPTDFRNFMGAVIDRRAFDKISEYIEHGRGNAKILAGGKTDGSKGYFISPTLIETADPGYKLLCEEIFGPVLTAHVYDDAKWEETLKIVDSTSPYALTGAVFAQDRRAIVHAMSALRHAAGNFYVNDKPTGAVVGQQPFGGARGSGTNDKAGSKLNLTRWVSARTVKENFKPPTDYRYPFMNENGDWQHDKKEPRGVRRFLLYRGRMIFATIAPKAIAATIAPACPEQYVRDLGVLRRTAADPRPATSPHPSPYKALASAGRVGNARGEKCRGDQRRDRRDRRHPEAADASLQRQTGRGADVEGRRGHGEQRDRNREPDRHRRDDRAARQPAAGNRLPQRDRDDDQAGERLTERKPPRLQEADRVHVGAEKAQPRHRQHDRDGERRQHERADPRRPQRPRRPQVALDRVAQILGCAHFKCSRIFFIPRKARVFAALTRIPRRAAISTKLQPST